MKKIGLFFGSFNPVHIGHMIVADFMLSNTDLDQVWMVVSPHNPHKQKKSLAKDYDRLHLVRLAIGDYVKIKASNIEFELPKPSYTVDTLIYLKEKYPNDQFVLLMGGDNLTTFHKWKNYEVILKNYEIYVYKRPNSKLGSLQKDAHIKVFDAPQLHISASYIRKCIMEGKSIRFLVPFEVYEYINGSSLYKD